MSSRTILPASKRDESLNHFLSRIKMRKATITAGSAGAWPGQIQPVRRGSFFLFSGRDLAKLLLNQGFCSGTVVAKQVLQ
jgi:hypothetical protein